MSGTRATRSIECIQTASADVGRIEFRSLERNPFIFKHICRWRCSWPIRLVEAVEQVADASPSGFDGAIVGLSQQGFSFEKSCSMGLRSGTYGGRNSSASRRRGWSDGRPCPCGCPGFRATTTSPGFSVGASACSTHVRNHAVDRSVQYHRVDPIVAQGGDEDHRRPPAAGAGHVGLGPGLVDEHQSARVNPVLVSLPSRPLASHVGSILFGGVQALFQGDPIAGEEVADRVIAGLQPPIRQLGLYRPKRQVGGLGDPPHQPGPARHQRATGLAICASAQLSLGFALIPHLSRSP